MGGAAAGPAGGAAGRLPAALAVGGLVILLAVTGCTAGAGAPPAPTTGPTATSSRTASATPAPTLQYKPADANGPAQNVPLPVKPPQADDFSKEGLEAFARYWYETLSYAYETGDTKPMEAITDPACTTCASAKSAISKWHSDGRWIVGGKIVVSATQSAFVKTDAGRYQAITQLEQDAGALYDADKSLNTVIPKSDLMGDIVETTYSEGHWVAHVVEHIANRK